ncbi:collagen alpha-5(VI) chain-like isoform X3 [Mobula hypostoma]|uniref:collagen alpha-5(VI) chain-like isoform X3 n=1 Tax=Mobula hypostoma TaxID=723540 RepID=UPI002FC338D6
MYEMICLELTPLPFTLPLPHLSPPPTLSLPHLPSPHPYPLHLSFLPLPRRGEEALAPRELTPRDGRQRRDVSPTLTDPVLCLRAEHVPETVDVVFLFDGSNSISRRDLEQIKKFMLRTMEEADAGMQAQRKNLRNIVNNIQLMESATYTATGINFTINRVFTEEAGAREGAKKVVIVITDGATTPGDINVTEVIRNAQEKGIFRIAIGVGDSFEKGSRGLSELTTIASCTRCLIKIKDYSLHSVLQDVQSKIDTIDECTAEMVDVVFLFDGSNSFTKRDLEANKKFMLNMMQASGANTQFAIVQYSLYSRTEMNFTTFRTQPGNLREIVNNFQLMESLTFTATGINFTIDNVFTEEAGAREGVARLLVLITDGQPTPGDIDLNQVVARAQEKQILRFVVRTVLRIVKCLLSRLDPPLRLTVGSGSNCGQSLPAPTPSPSCADTTTSRLF